MFAFPDPEDSTCVDLFLELNDKVLKLLLNVSSCKPACILRQRPGGYSQKIWVGVCGPLPKTLTLFMSKICDFPYPIYDLTKNLIPFL